MQDSYHLESFSGGIQLFESKEENEKHMDKKRLKVNKQFMNEVKEKEQRKKTPRHLIDRFFKEVKKLSSKKSTD